jgi:hypothetical protein
MNVSLHYSVPIGPRRTEGRGGGDDEEMDEEDLRRYEKGMRKREFKALQKTHEAVLDELAPRETGR